MFDDACRKRKLKVNVKHKFSKVIVFEMGRIVAIDFGRPYRVIIEEPKELDVSINLEKMEDVDEFKYLGSVFCNNGSLEGETREGCLWEKDYFLPEIDDEGEYSEQGC